MIGWDWRPRRSCTAAYAIRRRWRIVVAAAPESPPANGSRRGRSPSDHVLSLNRLLLALRRAGGTGSMLVTQRCLYYGSSCSMDAIGFCMPVPVSPDRPACQALGDWPPQPPIQDNRFKSQSPSLDVSTRVNVPFENAALLYRPPAGSQGLPTFLIICKKKLQVGN